MSLATASCDLWQNEHRKISSDDLVFTRLYSFAWCGSRRAIASTRYRFAPGRCSGFSREGRSYRFSGLVDDIVYDSVLLRLLRIHDEIALHVFFHLIELLGGVLGE